MRIKLIRAIRKPPWLKVWSAITAIALTIALALTFLPYQVDIDTTGILSIGLRQASANPGWLSEWDYRKEITVTNASADYQTKVLIGKTSAAVGEDVDCDGHIADDFDDLRFTRDDETTLIDYWIESVADSGGTKLATVWVQNTAGANTTLYMYYDGTETAPGTSQAMGEATFLFFDHFDGTYPGTKWTGNTGSGSVASSILTFTGAAGAARDIYSPTQTGIGDIALRARANYAAASYPALYLSENPDDGTDLFGAYSGGPAWVTYKAGSSTVISTATVGAGTYHIFDFCRLLTGTDTVKVFYDGGQIGSDTTTNVPTVDVCANPHCYNAVSIYIDWILIRKYAATEPTFAFGSEEAVPPALITDFIYNKKLTFNTTAISVTSNQTNFPVCIDINSSSWPTESERTAFFNTWNVGGKRCQFFDADGTTNLDYEIELSYPTLTTITRSTGINGAHNDAWSHNGTYLAVASYLADRVEVFEFNGINLTSRAYKEGANYNDCCAVAWSPNDQYLVVNCCEGDAIEVLEFTGSDLVSKVRKSGADWNGSIYSDWSPDGTYIVAGLWDGNVLRVMEFTGSDLVTKASLTGSAYNQVRCVKWRPSGGNYIAVTSEINDSVEVLEFTGSALVSKVLKSGADWNSAQQCQWSRDGTYLAITSFLADAVEVAEFTVTDLVRKARVTSRDGAHGIDWSPDGRYIAFVLYGSNILEVMEFTGSSLTTRASKSYLSTDFLHDMEWSYDGRYIAFTALGSQVGDPGGDFVEVVEVIDEAIYWVRVPQVDGSSTTDYIWVAYGNDPNGTDQDNPIGVWDSNFKATWHLPNLNDSTVNANTLTNNNAAAFVTGKIGDCVNLTRASSQYLSRTAPTGLPTGATARTFSYWVHFTALPSSGQTMSAVSYGAAATRQLFEGRNDYATTPINAWGLAVYADDLVHSGVPVAATWYFVTLTYNGATVTGISINGAAEETRALGAALNTGTSLPFRIGVSSLSLSHYVDGKIDEMRMSNIKRTADWTKLEYYSMKKTNFNGDSWLSWDAAIGGPEITNTPSSWAIGVVATSTVKYFSATGAQDDDYSLITNTGTCAVDIQIQGQNIEGGSYDWALASSAGNQQYSLYANSEATPTVYDIEVKSSSYNNLCTGLVEDDTYNWSMKFTAPAAFHTSDDGNQKTCTVTLVASEAA